MSKKTLLALLLVLFSLAVLTAEAAAKNWAIVINTNDRETAWNAMRVARFSLKQGNSVSVFFLGKGVQAAVIDDEQFNVQELLEDFARDGGEVHACKACLRLHRMSPGESCPAGTLKILYGIIDKADKVLIF